MYPSEHAYNNLAVKTSSSFYSLKYSRQEILEVAVFCIDFSTRMGRANYVKVALFEDGSSRMWKISVIADEV